MEPAQLPPPMFCDACASVNIQFRKHKKRRDAFVWSCLDCKASVGAHAGTQSPFGQMADAETRQLRHEAHEAFDALWQVVEGVRGPYMNRSKAYVWLSHALDIAQDNCHISTLSKEQLRKVVVLSNERAGELERARKRRGAKKRQQREEDAQREKARIDFRKSNRRKQYR